MNALSPAVAAPRSDRAFYLFAALFSAAALSLLGYILMVREAGAASIDLRFMPAVNAALNSMATVLLVSAYVAIRRGKRQLHAYLMVSALAASALFLVGYVAYHYVHGDTKFVGPAGIRAVYLAILTSHVLLSITALPMILTTVYFSATGRLAKHRRLARWTLPIWLYVSVTGVVIFFMLRGAGVSRPPAIEAGQASGVEQRAK